MNNSTQNTTPNCLLSKEGNSNVGRVPPLWAASIILLALSQMAFYSGMIAHVKGTGLAKVLLGAMFLFYGHCFFFAFSMRLDNLKKQSLLFYLHGMMLPVWYLFWLYAIGFSALHFWVMCLIPIYNTFLLWKARRMNWHLSEANSQQP